jgi:hypothetical protein
MAGEQAYWEALMELAEPAIASGVGPLISAQYAGRCPCGSRWKSGDFIAFSNDDDSWLCADCAAG